MTNSPPMPSFRNWERFWDLHLTPEFRDADAHTASERDCNALESLDSLRGFFSALAGPTGDAPVPVSVNAVFVQIANHLASNHEFDMRDESEYSDTDFSEIAPVIDQLYASMTSGILVMVRSTLNDLRYNPN